MTRRKAKPVAADPIPVNTSEPAPAFPAEGLPTEHLPEHPPTHHRPHEHTPEHHRSDDHPAGEPGHAAAVRPDGPRVPNPFGHRQDAVAGVRLLEDRRFKQLQLKFAGKPSDAVRQAVAAAGWRWRAGEEHWTRQIDPERGWQTRAEAEELFDRVAATIREEKGITREHA